MSDLDRLRDEVRKRRGAVTGKIARIRRNTGVDIAGKADDPRKPLDVVKRYNTRQLRSYLAKLNAFQSRSIGFVAGAAGVPIPKSKWSEYKKLEAKYNATAVAHEARIADTFIPSKGITIRQAQSMIHPTAVGDVVNKPYAPVDRRSSHVKDINALIRDMQRKNNQKFLPGEIKKSRGQLNDMLTSTGNVGLIGTAKKLTAHQFDTLWNYTNFATLVSLMYEMVKLTSTSTKDGWQNRVAEGAEDDIRELFEWANQLPKSPA